VPPDESDPEPSEVVALLLAGQIRRAVEIIEIDLAQRPGDAASCEACDRLVGHTSRCPLRYWR
jgi:hypothetical protein